MLQNASIMKQIWLSYEKGNPNFMIEIRGGGEINEHSGGRNEET